MEILNNITGLHLVIFTRIIAGLGVLIGLLGCYISFSKFYQDIISIKQYIIKFLPYAIIFYISIFAFSKAIMFLIWFDWLVLLFFVTMFFIFCCFVAVNIKNELKILSTLKKK